ncbi:MAG: isoleucine--tRNA ligase [Longimicrobiales bacterium]
MTYPDYPAGAIALEEAMLRRWQEEELFQRTLEATAGAPEFVFYEGPPTANGKPGIHHVLGRTLKDTFCRFHSMQGRHVTRIAGWDTHGLPVEIEAEKRLGISGKKEIEALGVARFNQVCRDSVFTYKEDWERLSDRIGYWLDYSRPYVTFTPAYIESVWWILKQLWDRDLIYRGHKSVAYCPRCGTALSSHEVAQGYQEVDDPSLYFLAPLLGPDGADDPAGRAFLVWTTTPWTLPANVALAIHPDLTYAEVEHGDRGLILAESRVASVLGEGARIRARHAAADLVGLRYASPFQLLPVPQDAAAWRVVAEAFVSAEEGTGIVHLAPAFGADDHAAGQKHGLPMLAPVDDAGRFDPTLPLVGGMFVKDADAPLVADLHERGLVFRCTLVRHTYPHCWRCESPLLYMARSSWYVRTTALKQQLLENNRAIRWYPPEVGTGRMGEWLAGNVDWALSRDRYWGTPLPIWVCDGDGAHAEIIGSFAELASRAGPLPVDFDPHKPGIDAMTWACEECAGTMRRTPEVIDVWFDSGSMPFAQWHYPFENQDAFERHFPADFICEGVDQTRGWFYSLLAISTLLGRGPAYRNVMVNDLVLDAEGQKMSKSRGNVVDPWDAIARSGADAIRWYFATASQPWVPKRFDPDALGEAARRVFDTLANTYRFFALYANLENWRPSAADPAPGQRPVMDRWVLARLDALVRVVQRDLEDYDVTRAYRSVADFVVDDLSNWYVRRSRDRFWGAASADVSAAFRTLADVLATVARLLAPITPFHADWLHRAIRGESVHLALFPQPDAELAELDAAFEREHGNGLLAGMVAVRELARLGRAAREQARIRVRQPLRSLHAVVPNRRPLPERLLEVLRDELNVKEIHFPEDATALVRYRAEPNFRVLGPRLGGRMRAAAEAIRNLTPEGAAALVRGETIELSVDGEPMRFGPAEIEVRKEARGDLLVESGEGFTAALDPTIDEALRAEGLARELVNRIQRLRREAGLAVQDRIELGLFGNGELLAAAAMHRDYIAGETLARHLTTGTDVADGAYSTQRQVDVDGALITIGMRVAG